MYYSPCWEAVDDDDVYVKCQALEDMPHVSEARVCAYIGTQCQAVHKVNVPALTSNRGKPITGHEDLDVFLWLPGSPYGNNSNFASLRDGRTPVVHRPEDGSENIVYVFVHYVQVRNTLPPSKSLRD